jgi:hypothetical protein
LGDKKERKSKKIPLTLLIIVWDTSKVDPMKYSPIARGTKSKKTTITKYSEFYKIPADSRSYSVVFVKYNFFILSMNRAKKAKSNWQKSKSQKKTENFTTFFKYKWNFIFGTVYQKKE